MGALHVGLRWGVLQTLGLGGMIATLLADAPAQGVAGVAIELLGCFSGALNGEVLRGAQRGRDAERRGHELAPTHDLAGGRFVGGEQHAGREVDPQARMQLKAALRGRAARPQAQGAAERQRTEAGMPQPSHPPSWPHNTRSAPRVPAARCAPDVITRSARFG